MKSLPNVIRWGILTACTSLVLGGCAAGAGGRQSARTRPMGMPTIAPRGADLPGAGTERDTAATALQQARRNEFPLVMETLGRVQDPTARARLSTELATALAAEDPQAAVAFAGVLPSSPTRTAVIETAARAMLRQDRETVLARALAITDPSLRSSAVRTLAPDLVHTNARDTVEKVRAMAPSPSRDDTLGILAAAWAREDLDGTIAWLRELPDDDLRRQLTSGVGFEIAQLHPDRALRLAEMLPEGRDRWLLFSAIAQTWVAVDAKAAMAWAAQLPGGEPRDAAFAGLDTGLGIPRTRRIAGAPVTRGGSSRTRGGAGVGMPVASLPQVESPDFKAWAATQPPGASRDDMILEYVRQRGALEPSTMGAWLATLPGDPTRDRAMEIYLENVLPTAPGDAARWLRSLPRSERSDEMVEKTARRWLLTSPDAAAAWLQDTNLPPDRKQRLLQEAGR